MADWNNRTGRPHSEDENHHPLSRKEWEKAFRVANPLLNDNEVEAVSKLYKFRKPDEYKPDLDDDTIKDLKLLERRIGKTLAEILEYWFEQERDYIPPCIRENCDPDVGMCTECQEFIDQGNWDSSECPDRITDTNEGVNQG